MRISDWSSDVCSSDLAETAWRVLRACEHVPGTQKDGSIDADELRAFVTEARRMAIEQDRAGACDTTLGQILAHAPEGQRSEEHTSELQSLMRISYAVFCLKKKKK